MSLTLADFCDWADHTCPMLEPKYNEWTFDFYYNIFAVEKYKEMIEECFVKSGNPNVGSYHILQQMEKNNDTAHLSHKCMVIITDDLKNVFVKVITKLMDLENGEIFSTEWDDILVKELENLRFKRTAQTCTPYGFI